MSAPALSIIIPVLNEAETIRPALEALALLRARGVEVIVADGGSDDGSGDCAAKFADQVVTSERGRGAQMNAGAVVARGGVLLFLHVDTQLPDQADRLVLEGVAETGRAWGRFDVTITGESRLLPVVAALMNVRSRLTGIATGDQAMFMTREAFAQVGGFPDIALMEDIAMSRRLKRLSWPMCLRVRVITSGRRWDKRGAMRTIVEMWGVRLAYFLGVSPSTLATHYGYLPRDR